METGQQLRTAIAEWGVSEAATVDEATSSNLPEAETLASGHRVKLPSDGHEDGAVAGGLRPLAPPRHLLSGYLEQPTKTKYDMLQRRQRKGVLEPANMRRQAWLRSAA